MASLDRCMRANLPSCATLASSHVSFNRRQAFRSHIATQHRMPPPLFIVSSSQQTYDDYEIFEPSSDAGPAPTASCYGCGAPLQIANDQAPGFVESEKFNVKHRHRQLHQLLCARCQALSNGAMIPGVADFQQIIEKKEESETSSERPTGYSAKTLATPEELREQLHVVRDSRALVVLLIDLLDASGSLLGRIRELVGGNPIIVVGTKMDLLPSGTDPADVHDWLCSGLAFKRIATEAVHIVSSRTGDGVAEAVATVRQLRLGRDVYIMGAANVGKSSFVRALVKDMSSMKSRQYDPLAPGRSKHLPVESAMPGTTLRTIPLEVFSSGGTLYDTPGLHLHHRVPHILTPEENKELHPRKRLKGFVPSPSPAQVITDAISNSRMNGESEVMAMATYNWGGLARIDVLACPPETQLVFNGPTALKVWQPTSAVEVENESSRSVSVSVPSSPPSHPFGVDSVAARGGLRIAREVEMTVDGDAFEAIGDVAISGVPGWISVLAGPRLRRGGSTGDAVRTVKLQIWAPVGVEAFVRPPLPTALPEQLLPLALF